MKSKRTIQRHLKALRELIDLPDTDVITSRIAYAMQIAVRWATEDGLVVWPGLVDEAIANGIIANKGEPK